MKALKTTRIAIATLMLLCLAALLLDTTGMLRHWFGWIPKLQLLPNIMALNVVMVVAVLVVTLLIGRFYCAVVCPLGIMQDLFTWLHKIIFRKHKFHYMKASTVNVVRYTVMVLFVVAMLVGMNSIAALIAPYSTYGRIVVNLHSSGVPQVVAIISLCVIGLSSFAFGRLWCNAVCPVGSLLSLISRHSIIGIRIDKSKCVGCHRCEHGCKSMCIDIDGAKNVDRSRCVNCFNCLGQCKVGAISFTTPRSKKTATAEAVDSSRRQFVAGTVAVGATMAVQAQEQKVDGGLATLLDKQVPVRTTPIKPFGALSHKNFNTRCTSCQLCVSQCPEHVLMPSTSIEHFMQPELNYRNGYCRTACTRCSQVCPAGAIQPITREEKTAISIGRAITLHQNCISAQGEQCGACARHCPTAAISMITDSAGNQRPVVNEARCMGCGACEYYCPARPQTAIYVEGRTIHTEI